MLFFLLILEEGLEVAMRSKDDFYPISKFDSMSDEGRQSGDT